MITQILQLFPIFNKNKKTIAPINDFYKLSFIKIFPNGNKIYNESSFVSKLRYSSYFKQNKNE